MSHLTIAPFDMKAYQKQLENAPEFFSAADLVRGASFINFRIKYMPPRTALGENIKNRVVENHTLLKQTKIKEGEYSIGLIDTIQKISKGVQIIFFVPQSLTPTCDKQYSLISAFKTSLAKLNQSIEVSIITTGSPDAARSWIAQHSEVDPVEVLADSDADLAWSLGCLQNSGPNRGLGSIFPRMQMTFVDGVLRSARQERANSDIIETHPDKVFADLEGLIKIK